jgi:hypothetical protein
MLELLELLELLEPERSASRVRVFGGGAIRDGAASQREVRHDAAD